MTWLDRVIEDLAKLWTWRSLRLGLVFCALFVVSGLAAQVFPGAAPLLLAGDTVAFVDMLIVGTLVAANSQLRLWARQAATAIGRQAVTVVRKLRRMSRPRRQSSGVPIRRRTDASDEDGGALAWAYA